MPQMGAALVLFGLGESMSMTPVMDDMMSSCGAMADASVNALSSLMASSFSLGQMIGPLLGSAVTARLGFPSACSAMALVLLLHSSVIVLTDYWVPRAKRASDGQAYTELSTVGSKFVDDDQNI
jgi:predicted MFS family arabinose efflux permease